MHIMHTLIHFLSPVCCCGGRSSRAGSSACECECVICELVQVCENAHAHFYVCVYTYVCYGMCTQTSFSHAHVCRIAARSVPKSEETTAATVCCMWRAELC